MSRVPNFIVLLAIVMIAALESYALSRGIDGVALSLSIGAIAGLGGVKLGELLKRG